MVRFGAALAACWFAAMPAGVSAQETAPIAADAAAIVDMPAPPMGSAPGFVPPPRDAGGYRTANRDLAADEVVWHLRVALNVAALGCKGLGDAATAAGYDALLDADRVPFAAAHAGAQARYRIRRGAAAEAAFDDDMTRLYNFFAQPPAHAEFCATAAAVLDEASRVPPEALAGFAPNALAALEAPFTRFFAAYDAYREALAAWRARRGNGGGHLVIATAAPIAVGPRP